MHSPYIIAMYGVEFPVKTAFPEKCFWGTLTYKETELWRACDGKSRRISQFHIASEVVPSILSAVYFTPSEIDCNLSSASVFLSHSVSDRSEHKEFIVTKVMWSFLYLGLIFPVASRTNSSASRMWQVRWQTGVMACKRNRGHVFLMDVPDFPI